MVSWFTRLSIPNSTLIGSAVFAQLKPEEGPYTLQWAAVPLQKKLLLPMRDVDPI